MNRLTLSLAIVGAIAQGGCAEIECDDYTPGPGAVPNCPGDDRPATLEYVTTTILRPACANAQCHSAFANTFGLRFDTVEHAQQSLVQINDPANPGDDILLVVPGDPDASLLYSVLVRESIDGEFPRMPYDQPLPGPDIALIRRWIAEGADGLVIP